MEGDERGRPLSLHSPGGPRVVLSPALALSPLSPTLALSPVLVLSPRPRVVSSPRLVPFLALLLKGGVGIWGGRRTCRGGRGRGHVMVVDDVAWWSSSSWCGVHDRGGVA